MYGIQQQPQQKRNKQKKIKVYFNQTPARVIKPYLSIILQACIYVNCKYRKLFMSRFTFSCFILLHYIACYKALPSHYIFLYVNKHIKNHTKTQPHVIWPKISIFSFKNISKSQDRTTLCSVLYIFWDVAFLYIFVYNKETLTFILCVIFKYQIFLLKSKGETTKCLSGKIIIKKQRHNYTIEFIFFVLFLFAKAYYDFNLTFINTSVISLRKMTNRVI